MIKINSLHKYFNKGRQNEIHVINNVSLELPERGMVAIFGESGCGKTTLLNVIGGLDKFASGTLTIEDQSIGKNTDDIRNKYTGFIFQNYNLQVGETNYENVADALRLCGMTDESEIETRVMAALANVGMDKFAKRTPDTLSGGQQQRIAIARAIVKNPRIILADEPTGNLDETNTVLIMDLLKQISKDHLVLLVTHEAHLVDYYCDTVIELNDGQVVNIRSNEGTNGYSARDKNHIYLGELEETKVTGENAELIYYGDALAEPLKLTVVNSGGKLYLRIDTPKVQVLDAVSEVKLKEGVYKDSMQAKADAQGIDMSKLPPVEGTEFGRLFHFKSSVKSGFRMNFRKDKKGKKMLRRCMCLFAAVLVFMCATFGTAFRDVIDAKQMYSENVFYVKTSTGDVSDRIQEAAKDDDSAIQYYTLAPYGLQNGVSQSIYFEIGHFETFQTDYYVAEYQVYSLLLGQSLAERLSLVEGKMDGLATEEMVITTAVADELIEKSPVGYIEEYSDLIGLLATSVNINGKNLRVAGVVESEDMVMFVSDVVIAKLALASAATQVYLDTDVDMEVATGETVYFMNEWSDQPAPQVGESVKIHGKEFVVSKVPYRPTNYPTWLEMSGIEMFDEQEYFVQKLLEQDPSLEGNDALDSMAQEMYEENYGEYLCYYFSHGKEYLADSLQYNPENYEAWLAVEKDNLPALGMALSMEYYIALRHYEATGTYPSITQIEDMDMAYDDVAETLDYSYYEEFQAWMYSAQIGQTLDGGGYVLDEADFLEISRRYGESHPGAVNLDEIYTIYWDEETDEVYELTADECVYTMIYSSDPEKTEAYLSNHFDDVKTVYEAYPALMTPDMIFGTIIDEQKVEILTNLISMGVFVVLMSICMFFIMRSSLMSRIKEVGIYRAIGVSKKNLTFRFAVEAGVLTTLTVFLGYLGASAFIYVLKALSGAMVENFFFYPWWYALLVLAFLYAICLLCGVIPIRGLLRKTPSEILAKYDI